MCFDISSTKIKQLVEKNQNASFYSEFDYEPFYHVNGFSYPSMSIIKNGESDTIYPATWGFIPEWGEKDVSSFRKKYNTLNAKKETLLSSAMYKDSVLYKRCLIIADGFFEPHKSFTEIIPFYCYLPASNFEDGRDVFVFAGIYSETNNQISCTIITTEANSFFGEIHNIKKRMPLVLDNDLKKDWLDPNLQNSHIKELMEVGFTNKEFKAHSVSKRLYQRKRYTNIASSLEPISHNTLFD